MEILSWDELRSANRKMRGIEESDYKICESCQVQHDCADIYDVDGQELCETCKAAVVAVAKQTIKRLYNI